MTRERKQLEFKAADGKWAFLRADGTASPYIYATRDAAREARTGKKTAPRQRKKVNPLDAIEETDLGKTETVEEFAQATGIPLTKIETGQDTACLPETPAVDSGVSVTRPPMAASGDERMHQIQLTKAVQEKGGNIGYRREGVRATVYFNKNIFNGAVPETVTITADGDTNPFTQPGETRAGGTPNPERAAKAAERAQKAQERAAKAAERAAKAQARADKLAGKTAAAATE